MSESVEVNLEKAHEELDAAIRRLNEEHCKVEGVSDVVMSWVVALHCAIVDPDSEVAHSVDIATSGDMAPWQVEGLLRAGVKRVTEATS
jgi:RNA polymerase subunit RPABC4/transcription elongation factor Spt4